MGEKEYSMLSGVQSLDNEKRLRILGIIDQFRELGVGENVSLPKLVVVGDQSSGKSSLLEGLTGLSFPVDSDLCTRFATQIVLRRVPAKDADVKVTIIPGPTAQADETLKEQLQQFERTFDAETFGPVEFATSFDEAAKRMGLPGPNSKEQVDLEKRFSDDILKIELSGPNQQHLSVVDVPGLFHNPTKYQTKEDRDIIRALIQTYITDKRTIILAVLDAKNNLANQEVFSMARAADSQGARTVGIITKCDTLEPGDEEGVLRIARNEIEKLHHGWFAVKNRSTKDIRDGVTTEQRHVRERAFFASKAPWTELSKERVGIEKVRSFLGNLLYDHIRNEFPSMVKELESSTRSTKSELDFLGPSRQTAADQRRVLMHIASAYQAEVSKALSGNYAPGLPLKSALKLRLRIRRLNDEFSQDMAHRGHARVFRTANNAVDERYSQSTNEAVAVENIYDWLRVLYRDSQGVELPGTVNPIVLENMFREQSSPWKEISSAYLTRAIQAVKEFNDRVFNNLISDEELKRKLRSRLERQESLALQDARKCLEQLLGDEREGILQTVDYYYAETLSAIREERVKARVSLGLQSAQPVSSSQIMTRMHLSNEDQAVYDVHDILKAYYKVALKRFTDNVIIQVTERHLLGAKGPVRILSPDLISELSDIELATIASESFAKSSLRLELQARTERLRRALELANQAGI